jgi:exosome complex exonuclease RRP6
MKDFQEVRDGLIAALQSLTNSSRFLKPSEVLFLRSDLELSKKFDSLAAQTVTLIKDTARVEVTINENESFHDDYINQNVDEDFKRIVGVLDDFYETADIHLDAVTKSLKKKTFQTVATLAPFSLNDGGTLHTFPRHFQPIPKPQLTFRVKVDNSNSPWTPIIKSKPNSMKPLDAISDLSDEVRKHLSTFGHAR